MPQILWGSTQEFWQFKVSLRVSQLTLTKNFQPVHEINGINHHRLHWARWKVSKKWVFFSISDGISQKLFAVQVWLKIEVSLKELQRMRERTLGNLWVYSANFWTKKPPKDEFYPIVTVPKFYEPITEFKMSPIKWTLQSYNLVTPNSQSQSLVEKKHLRSHSLGEEIWGNTLYFWDLHHRVTTSYCLHHPR